MRVESVRCFFKMGILIHSASGVGCKANLFDKDELSATPMVPFETAFTAAFWARWKAAFGALGAVRVGRAQRVLLYSGREGGG